MGCQDRGSEAGEHDLYRAFVNYCTEQQLPATKPNSFARSLQNQVAYRIKATRPEVDGKRVTAWQGIKLSVRDVRDVSDFPLLKVELVNTDIEKKITKIADIPDAIALITHDTKPLTENGELPDYTATLGMPVEDAIKLWKSAGAPVIYLGPGENCLDLGKVLSNSGIADRHLKAVKAWLQKHKGGVLC